MGARIPRFRLRSIMIVIAFVALVLGFVLQAIRLVAVEEQLLIARAQARTLERANEALQKELHDSYRAKQLQFRGDFAHPAGGPLNRGITR